MSRNLYGAIRSWLALLRQLPGFAPFLPLLWASLFRASSAAVNLADVPGTLTQAERERLTLKVRGMPETATIVQAGKIETDATCALAAGCWASERHLYVLWPESADEAAEFRAWHRAIIRRGLAPYVTPVVGEWDWRERGPVDLVYTDSAQGWADQVQSGTVLVRAGGNIQPRPIE